MQCNNVKLTEMKGTARGEGGRGGVSWVGILSKSVVVDITWGKVHTEKERRAATNMEAK